MIRVLLVDDHAAFREPLAFLLAREPDLEVVGEAGSLAEARTTLPAVMAGGGFDIACVDLWLPDGDGLEIIRAVRAAAPLAAALVVTGDEDPDRLADAVEAGAAGLVRKSRPIAEIVAAVRDLGKGEPLLAPQEVVDLLRRAGLRREADRAALAALASLSPREREVLELLAEGLGDREIATRLHISHQTVRTHMVNLLGKLGLTSRLQALVFAVRHGAVRIR